MDGNINMGCRMDKFVEGFQHLQLQATTPVNYQGAKYFAAQFHKASVLTENAVKYSSSSAGLIKAEMHATIPQK